MHPARSIAGVEIDPEVADGRPIGHPHQVTYAIARAAIIGVDVHGHEPARKPSANILIWKLC